MIITDIESETTISKTTPRLLMWMCDGRQSPGQLPIPSGEGLDYLSNLKQRCEDGKNTRTPIILCYEGRLISEEQKDSMENLVKEEGFENLFMVDYGEFEKRCEESPEKYEVGFTEKIENSLHAFKANSLKTRHGPQDDMKYGSIAYLVDSTRLHLLDRCNILKNHLEEKYEDNPSKGSLINGCAPGLIYLDFDVSQQGGISDVKINSALQGFFCSTNFLPGKFLNDDPDMEDFNNKYLKDGKGFRLMNKIKEISDKLEDGDMNDPTTSAKFKQEESNLYLEYLDDRERTKGKSDEVMNNNIYDDFDLENSLIGVNKEDHGVIKTIINHWVPLEQGYGDKPYGSFKNAISYMYGDKNVTNKGMFRKAAAKSKSAIFGDFDVISDSMTSDHHGFQVGHDNTWKDSSIIEYTTPLNQVKISDPDTGKPSASYQDDGIPSPIISQRPELKSQTNDSESFVGKIAGEGKATATRLKDQVEVGMGLPS